MKVHIVVGTCEHNSSLSFKQMLLKLYRHFACGLRIYIHVLLESSNYVFLIFFSTFLASIFFLLQYLGKWYRISGPLVNLLIFNSSNKNKAGYINSYGICLLLVFFWPKYILFLMLSMQFARNVKAYFLEKIRKTSSFIVCWFSPDSGKGYTWCEYWLELPYWWIPRACFHGELRKYFCEHPFYFSIKCSGRSWWVP